MRPRQVLAAGATAIALITAACGGSDTTTAGDEEARRVDVDMVDIDFAPNSIEVAAGETVRFVFHNRGEVVHDAFLGDADAQADHEAEIRDEHGGHGSSDDAIKVDPGQTGELTHTFDSAGTVEIGCHEPGHYDAGMKIVIDVL